MKRYVRAGKIRNFITQQIAKKFDENDVICKALLGTYKGHPMMYVYLNIISDPHVTIGNPDELIGKHDIYYDGKVVGYLEFLPNGFGMGEIKDGVYENKIQKRPESELNEAMQIAFGQMMDSRFPGFTDALNNMRRPDFGADYDAPALNDGYDDFGDGYDDLNGYY